MGERMLSPPNVDVGEEYDFKHITLVIGCHILQDCEDRTRGKFEKTDLGIFCGLISLCLNLSSI